MRKLVLIMCMLFFGCSAITVMADDKLPVDTSEEISKKQLKIGDEVVYLIIIFTNDKVVAWFRPQYFYKGVITQDCNVTGTKKVKPVNGEEYEVLCDKDEFVVKWDNGEESTVPARNLGRYRPKK